MASGIINTNGDLFERLQGMKEIPTNANLDNYKAVGTYHCGANATVSTLSNCPVIDAFRMTVSCVISVSSPTQEITTYFGDKYARTYMSWNSSWTAWSRVGKKHNVSAVTVVVNRALGSSVTLTAPTVSGYTFLCWLGTATSGWVGGTYIENMANTSSRVWVCASSNSSGTGNVVAWALYTEN